MIVFGSNRIGLIQRHHFSTSVVISNVYSMKEDLETLGLTVNSSKKDIKTAYFKRAKALHPDNIQSPESSNEKFQRLNDAYQRIMENLEKGGNINYHKAQSQERHQQHRHSHSRTQYQYDEKTDTWTDYFGNRFRFSKFKLTENHLRWETLWSKVKRKLILI